MEVVVKDNGLICGSVQIQGGGHSVTPLVARIVLCF